MTNLILLADSYKLSHHLQYPPGMQGSFSYFESRGGAYEKIVFFGLQYYLKEYLTQRITENNIHEAKILAGLHGVPFNEEGWRRILDECGGYLPLIIHAVPEGSVMPSRSALFTVANCRPGYGWLTSYVETLLSKLWYPCTVASKSYAVRQSLAKYYGLNGTDFAYHNFGDRGSTSTEAAAIGGAAHLTSFSGTDNFDALRFIKEYYERPTLSGPDKVAGFSIPASEHSTVTSWGRMLEFSMIENYLEAFKGKPMIACVLDSYNLVKAVDFVTSTLKDKIESPEYPVFVMRPDSGDPIDIIGQMLDICEKNGVAWEVTGDNKKLFLKYRIIWGDGITPDTIIRILDSVTKRGYAASNFAFGSGGDLMQNLNRDTCKFAYKCSAMQDGHNQWREVFKDPVTDPGKASKKGRLTTVKWKSQGWADNKIAQIQTIPLESYDPAHHEPLMRTVYEHGMLRDFQPFDEIRARVKEAR